MPVTPKRLMPYFCGISSIKATILQFDHILNDLFQNHCGDVQRHNDINVVTVQILLDLTALEVIMDTIELEPNRETAFQ